MHGITHNVLNQVVIDHESQSIGGEGGRTSGGGGRRGGREDEWRGRRERRERSQSSVIYYVGKVAYIGSTFSSDLETKIDLMLRAKLRKLWYLV